MTPLRYLADSPTTEPHRRGRVLRRSAAVLAVAALGFSACSSGDDTVSTDAEVSQSEDVENADVDPIDSAPDTRGENPEVVDAEPASLQENGPVEVDGEPLVPFDEAGPDPAEGLPAPVVRGESFDGTEIVIGAPTENSTMIVFLAHWCGHCNEEVPELIALEEAGRLPDGLDIVGVSTAVAADGDNYPPSQWVVDKGWPWPTMADDEIPSALNAFGGTSFPFTVVLDAEGTVLARRAGQATGDDTVAFLDAALADAAS